MRKIRMGLLILLIAALVLSFAAAQADGWKAAAENGPRFKALFDTMRAYGKNPTDDNRIAVWKAVESIRAENTDDGDIAEAIAEHWITVFAPDYRMYLNHGEKNALELEKSFLSFGDKHAFVVLGYRLEDGEMSEELLGRCKAAAAAAASFPNALLICTGGATGENNPDNHTEAGEMKKYLCKRCGIEATRVLTEENSLTTLENARNTFGMIRDAGVDTITIITSNYHQRWGQVLYNALAAIEEKNSGYKVRIVGNYSYPAPGAHSSLFTSALSQLSSMPEFGAK